MVNGGYDPHCPVVSIIGGKPEFTIPQNWVGRIRCREKIRMRNNVQTNLVERMSLLLRQEYGSRKYSQQPSGAETAKYQGLPRRKREAISIVDDAVDSDIGCDERLSRI